MSSKEENVKESTSPIVLTIGHSARTIEEFINLLLAHGVNRVVDVRTIPRSRHNPQFNADSLTRFAKDPGNRVTYPAENSPTFQSKPPRKRLSTDT